jgi:hypothetical protein
MDDYQAGNLKLSRADFKGARKHFIRCTDHVGAAWNLAQLDLLEGRVDRWPDHSIVPSGKSFNGSWQGSTQLPGRTWAGEYVDALDVVADQGAGDTLLFLRYLPEVRQRVKKLTVVCHKSLHRLVKSLSFVDDVKEEITEEFNTTFMQIAGILSKRVTIPPFHMDLQRDSAVEELVNSFSSGPRIGVCWTGNPQHPTNIQRSFPKEALYDLGVKPFNLQFGHYDNNFRSINATFTDFYSTAQVIQQMDLVIACSTSLSVLAPTLGVETWVLLDAVPYWMWGLKESTPWLQNVRLFRQEEPGNWVQAITHLRQALSEWLSQRKINL